MPGDKRSRRQGPSAGSNQGRSTKRKEDLFCRSGGFQIILLRKMYDKVKESRGGVVHLLPNNIQLLPQLDGRSLTQEMLVLTLRCTDLIPNQNILNNLQILTFNEDEGKDLIWRHMITLSFQGDKERRIALSISKLKAARYLDFGLEELVLFVGLKCYSESSDREAVRSHMEILSVISVKVFEKYEYNYLREIILRRADYQEYKTSEKDFKNLHPNDFEDLFLLNIQEKLNICPKSDKD
ncbi:hypothetical protein Tco_1067658 [Tanacetum coccineum]|uniref:Uncharacterized protein n=1 Tax=Tanacetum coccineum TaxID=301880 RepID=A0ABQ5HDH5_9ASTR